jgi:hypothetical protein
MTSPESPFFGVPSQIVDLAGNLVDFVETAIGIRPDFSPDTLSIVDHYASIAREEVKNRPEILDLTGQALGAFFGEVVRRSEGAFWRVPSPNYHDWRLCGLTSFVAINAIGAGYDALVGSTEHHGPSSQVRLAPEDREAIQERLNNLPAVPDNEFYSLCMRLEVLQIAMEAARGLASARGYEEVIYSDDDYSADLKPLGEI